MAAIAERQMLIVQYDGCYCAATDSQREYWSSHRPSSLSNSAINSKKRSPRGARLSSSKPPNYAPSRLPHIIDAAARRLEHTQIECSSYEVVLDRFDRPTTVKAVAAAEAALAGQP